MKTNPLGLVAVGYLFFAVASGRSQTYNDGGTHSIGTNMPDGTVSINNQTTLNVLVGGSITGGSGTFWGGGDGVDVTGGTVDILGGNVTGGTGTWLEGTAYGIVANGGSSMVNISSGSVLGFGGEWNEGPAIGVQAAGGGTVNIYGGSVQGYAGTYVESSAYGVLAQDGSTVNIHGGDVTGATAAWYGWFGPAWSIGVVNGSLVNIYGTNFNYSLGSSISDLSGTLTGTLSDGTAFNYPFTQDSAGEIILVAPGPSVNPAPLRNGNVGFNYYQRFTANGGSAPCTFTITSGALPVGATLSSNGVLSAGAFTNSGSYAFTVMAADTNGFTVSQSYNWAVTCPNITLSPGGLPGTEPGAPYSQTMTASGGSAPYAYTVTSGALPAGLTLSSDGVLSGATTTSSNYTFTVTATDAYGCTGSQSYTVAVAIPTISLSPGSLPGTQPGAAYSQTITVNGGFSPYTCAVTLGSVPPGLTFSSGGVLSGTPTNSGNYTFTVTATDAYGYTGSQSYTVAVNCPAITFGGSGNGTVFIGPGLQVLHGFTGGGDGANPAAGLILSGNTLYGTTESGGTWWDGTLFTVQTNGTVYSNLYNFTYGSGGDWPQAGLVLSGNTLYGTTDYGGGSWSGNVFGVCTDGTGFTNLYAFTGGGDGSLPRAGLILSGNTLYGTTTAGGSSGAGTVFAVNTDGTGFTNLYSFTGGGDGANPMAGLILSGNTLYGTTESGGASGKGAVFGVNTNGTGFTNLYSFTGGSDGANPMAGLILSGGTLYGTANGGGSSGKGVVFAVNTNGTGFANLYNFTGGGDGANPMAGLILSGNTLYGTSYGTAYSYGGGSSNAGTVFGLSLGSDTYNLIITASGGSAPYTYAITGGGLPPGLTLSSGGVLSGTTTNSGNYTFTVTATDVYGCTGNQGYVITGHSPVITVSPTNLPANVELGASYSQTIAASGGAGPYTYAVTGGGLPPGLTVSTGGVLSGILTFPGNYTFTVTATDAYGFTGSQSYNLVVASTPANTLISVNGGIGYFGDEGVGPGIVDDEYLCSYWTFTTSFTNVSFTVVPGALYFSAGTTVNCYLTDAVGPAATASNVIWSGSATFSSGGWDNGTTFFSGLNLGPGTYYLILVPSAEITWASAWGSGGEVIATTNNVAFDGTLTPAYDAADGSFPPASSWVGSDTGGDLAFTLTGDLSPSVPGPVATNIIVTPASLILRAGTNEAFTAMGYFSDGSSNSLTPANGLVWSSSNPGVATINSNGVATGLNAGTTTITAGLGGVTGGSLLTVIAAPVFFGSTFLGAAGADVAGTGIKIYGGNLYVCGNSTVSSGIIAGYATPLLTSGSPVWTENWPDSNPSDQFNAVTASGSGFYADGSDYTRTTDIVGGKEGKGLVAKFPLSGPTGTGYDGDIWDRQTPAPPGAFSYGGGEGLLGITLAVENGTNYLYAVGGGQHDFYNWSRLFVSKLAEDSTVLWTQTDGAEQVGEESSVGEAVAALNTNVYTAGFNDDVDPSGQPYLRKYSAAGSPAWVRRDDFVGAYFGITGVAGVSNYLYAVGYKGTNTGSSANLDFLIEKWDENGNQIWSRTFNRGDTQESLNAVVAVSGRLFAAGYTRGQTAGGADAVLIEFDPATGNLLSTNLFGGSEDDIANGVDSDGSNLYVVGESRSFGNGSNQIMVLEYSLGPVVTNIIVTPASPIIVAGTNEAFMATGYFSDGASSGLTSTNGLVWSSSNPGVATINSNGVATGLTSGVTTITANYGNINGHAALTVVLHPAITVQPTNNTVLPNGSVTLNVSATGGGLSYQWQFNGTNIVGATNATLTIASCVPANAGNYTVMVGNIVGSVTSQPATLTVLPIVLNGGFETGHFTDWTLSGNSGYLTISTKSDYKHSGSYGVQAGPVGSPGYLSQTLPTVAGQTYLLSLWLDSPDGATPNEFTVSWNGTTVFDGVNMGAVGWTNLQFIVDAASASSQLQIGVRNDPSYFGLDDISVTPIYSEPPLIALQPASQTLPIGGTARFNVTAIGTLPLAYQWYFNTNTPMGGATTAALVFGPVTTNQTGNYQVIVTNLYGSATSSPAGLTVQLVPNIYSLSNGAGGAKTLYLASIPGSTNRLWASTNLVQWQVIATNYAGSNGFFQFADTNTIGNSMKFYLLSWP